MTGEEAKWAGLGPEDMHPMTEPTTIERAHPCVRCKRCLVNADVQLCSWCSETEALREQLAAAKERIRQLTKLSEPVWDDKNRME